MGNVDKVRVKGEFYNIVSPSAFGDYIETIGGACTNPNGYAKDAIFLAKTNEVQNLYQATQAIAFGANIVVGTNCKQTTLDEVIKSMSGASTAADVSYSNTSSGLTATNAQAAIDEVNGKTNTNANNISSLNSALSNTNTALGNEVATRAKLGGHNLFKITATTGKYADVDVTVRSDGTLLVDGTSTGAYNVFLGSLDNLTGTNYILSGLPDVRPTTPNYPFFLIYDATAGTIPYALVTEDEISITLDSSHSYQLWLNIQDTGRTYDDVILKPMLRLATDSDTTYQPYSMTNQEITEVVSGKYLLDRQGAVEVASEASGWTWKSLVATAFDGLRSVLNGLASDEYLQIGVFYVQGLNFGRPVGSYTKELVKSADLGTIRFMTMNVSASAFCMDVLAADTSTDASFIHIYTLSNNTYADISNTAIGVNDAKITYLIYKKIS